jgi:hypothetical protein
MKSNQKVILPSQKGILLIGGIVLSVLVIPFLGNMISTSVNWGAFDFAVAGALMIIFGIGIEVIRLNVKSLIVRVSVLLSFVLILLLLWVELAVGIFGSPIAGS